MLIEQAGSGATPPAPIAALTGMWRALAKPATRLILKTAASALLLVWLVRNVDGTRLLAHVLEAEWQLFGVAVLIQAGLPLLMAERWRILCRQMGFASPLWRAVENVYVGQFFNQVLPSAIGGDAVRIAQLHRWQMPLGAAVGSIMLDRLIALSVVPALLAPGVVVFRDVMPLGVLAAALMASFGGVVAFWTALVWFDALVPARLTAHWPALQKLVAVSTLSRSALRPASGFVSMLAVSVAIHLLSGVAMWLLCCALGASASLTPFFVFTPVVAIVTMVPVSLGGWGVREGAVVAALSLLDVPTEIGLLVSVQYGLVMILVGLIGGIVWLAGSARPGVSKLATE